MSRPLSIFLFLSLAACLPAFAQLRVDFAPDKSGGCSPLIIHFSNRSSASASATYLWNFGNGNTSTARDPEAVFTNVGDYTVSLTVQDGASSSSASHTVSVYDRPKPTFTYGPNSVCGPQPITFTGGGDAGSGGTITRWLWDFGDGSTTTNYSASAQHVYPQSVNNLMVSLTVTNSYGCTDTIKQLVSVTVLTPATSSFSPDKRVLCNVTDPVQFTNTSTGPGPLTYSWDFGDGTGSTLPNPGHSYTQKGTYTITLKTTASNGCTATSSLSNYLNVANYQTDFDAPTSAVCVGTYQTFTDKSSPAPDSRVWTVDGFPAYYYTTYTYVFSAPGTHTVQLNNTYGNCPQTVTKTVTVNPLPAIQAPDMVTTQACDHFNIAFTDQTAGALSWRWNYNYYTGGIDVSSPGPSVSHDFSYGVSYAVRLTVTDANGCSNSVLQSVYKTQPPISIYPINPGNPNSCINPLTKTFAIQNGNLLQSFTWEFGDGGTSTDAQPTHTFSTPGVYGTVLKWTDMNGCTGTTNVISTVIGGAITLDFSADNLNVCKGTPVNFSGPTITGNGATAGGVNISWNFGDGSTWGGVSPTHTYSAPGVYPVTVGVTNGGGCQATLTKTAYITVKPAPGLFGGHSYTCNGDRTTVDFAYAPGTATGVVWSFGDGTTLTTGANTTVISHTYPRTGTYYVDVRATDGTCTNQNSDQVYVLKRQNMKLTGPASVCVTGTLNVSLEAERNPTMTYSGYGYDYSTTFYYDDGTPFTGQVNFTDYYNPYSNGAFHYTLSGFTPGKKGLKVVTSSNFFNCPDESNVMPLTIKEVATAAFTIKNGDMCYQSPVVVQDNSLVGAGNSIAAESWDFGDGSSPTSGQPGGTVSHLYTNPGQYTIRLTLTDAAGCTTTTGYNQNYVNVNGPKAGFTPYPGTDVNLNTTMFFNNTTNNYGSNGTVWSWDFGDGTGSSDYSPSYTYTAPGKYTVVLKASNPNQANTCVTEARATINVRNFNSHFGMSTSYVGQLSCPPVLAQFYNTSSNYISVSWDFGDGWTAGNVNAPSHVYQQPGRYIVTLNVQGYNGLTASYIDSIVVREPVAGLQTKTPIVCDGQPAVYEANAVGAKTYTFDFGDGSIGAASYPDSVITHNYSASGSYMARLIVTDTFGCPMAANTTVSLDVHPKPTVKMDPVDPYLCKDMTLTITATGGTDYLWSPAAGLNRTDGGTVIASPSGDTKYQVLVTDAVGCQNTGSTLVHVVFPQKLSVTPDSTAVCYGDMVQLTAKGTDMYSWLGDVQGGGSPGIVVARPESSVVYTVIGRDIHSCFSDTAHVIVTVLPVPSVNGGPDIEVLAGNPAVLQATGSSDVLTWLWTPADYLSCTDCDQPVASPKKPMTYVVKVTNGVGCSAKDTVVAKIICEESRVRIPDAFSPNGDGNNDRFVILGIGEVKHIMIFNRWGLKVFERSNFYPADAISCWDGMIGGHPAPAGTYAYFVEFDCPAGGVFSRRGTVVLVR